MTPQQRPEAFWDYADLALFLTLSIASMLAAAVLVRFVPGLHSLALAYQLLAGQIIWYVLVFAWLTVILRLRYNAPFWRSLGWFPPQFSQAVTSILFGPVLVLLTGILGVALRTPRIQLPFTQMLAGPLKIVLFGALVGFLGPVLEELAFRGFIMPLIVRSLGPTAGIIISAAMFGTLHGFEYPDWRYMILISLAGVAFGWARYRTGTTVNSALMHCTFNLTQFVGLLAAGDAAR